MPEAPAPPSLSAEAVALEKQTKSRFRELDALRGIAALTVVFHHFLLTQPAVEDTPNTLYWLKYTPIHAVWGGMEAVYFFFLLSGFVLALQFKGSTQPTYLGFVIKRIWRIYPAYWATVALAVIAQALVYHPGITGLSRNWFMQVWQAPLTAWQLVGHLLLVDDFSAGRLDPVLWSLVHEMRISLVFPLLILLMRRVRARILLPVGLAVSWAGCLALNREPLPPTGYLGTLAFLLIFGIGIWLSNEWPRFAEKVRSLSSAKTAALLGLAVLIYSAPYMLEPLHLRASITTPLQLWLTTLAGCIFMICALSWPPLSHWLTSRPMQYLGRTSYSIYLLHAVVVLTSIYLFLPWAPLWALFLPDLAVVLLLSGLWYRAFEKPGILIGHYLSKRADGLLGRRVSAS